MGKLLLLLVGLVLLELTVMIKVGSVIGALPTVGLLVLTAVLGSSLVRSEGIKTLLTAQQKMQLGEMPGREVMGGMMLALAGLLLIIPGFVSDIVGILLLQPWLRNMLADKLIGSKPAIRRPGSPAASPDRSPVLPPVLPPARPLAARRQTV